MEKLLSSDLKHKLETLPKEPGVYLMKDEDDRIIYVGKAINLANRVRQYFGTDANKQAKVSAMVAHIHTFDYIITDSELEALILECNLIKQHKPYYNILLRDDKHFPYVRIEMSADFPRVEIVRRVKDDGAKYFGPYIAAHFVRELLDAVHKLFPLRSCKKDMARTIKNKERPCLNKDMGSCIAPCTGLVSKEHYHEILQGVISLLNGKYRTLELAFREEMNNYSQNLEYEKAAVYRDKIALLKRVAERQKASFPHLGDKDIFAASSGEKFAIVQAFFVREGKLSLTERFEMDAHSNEGELLVNFLKQFYTASNVPKHVYIHSEIPEADILARWLGELRGSKVELTCPKRGENKKLADMAHMNAVQAISRKEEGIKKEYERTVGAAAELAQALGTGALSRIECYDISNTQGTDSVASMVVFVQGKPDKREYRRFKIKTVEGSNDFASMQEVLKRRMIQGIKSGDSTHGFGAMPDLVIVDGGKGQLSSAVETLESLGLHDLNIVGLAKREEELFLPGESVSIKLARNSPALRLVTAIRDEAHRFAITYHRNLREKRIITSELDRIKGVGNRRKLALIERFRDVEGVKTATLGELTSTPGVDISTARRIYEYFHPEKNI